MNRREFLRRTLGGAALALSPQLACRDSDDAEPARAPDGSAPPNVLLLTVDDMSWDSPGCYGGCAEGVTPHIDRLATEGMRLARAHVTVSVCAPSRAVLVTGRYPHRSEAVGFQGVAPEVPVLPERLAEAGYLRGILGKVRHLKPTGRYTWDLAVHRDGLGEGRDAGAYARHAAAFFETSRREGRPFFLMANALDPHRPFARSHQEIQKYGPGAADIAPPSRLYEPDEVRVPGFLPDLPEVRRELAQYCSSVRRADDVVGAVLAALEASGLADRTFVCLLSDNAMSFPFAKGNCYPHSTRVPWIVRWPGRIAPESEDASHFVSGIDFAPTVLDALGLAPLAGADGRSFLPVLEGHPQAGRERVVTVFHEDRRENAFPMRCIQDEETAYLFNAWSDGRTRFRNEGHNGLGFAAMVRHARTDPELARRVRFLLYRTPEELYDRRDDPNALANRAGDPAAAATLDRYRGLLRDWMRATGDPLLEDFSARLAAPAA